MELKTAEQTAQWVIDNRYPKSENEKVSDSEMYNTVKENIHSFSNERLAKLREMLEAEEQECITPTYCNGIRKALSLLNQLSNSK